MREQRTLFDLTQDGLVIGKKLQRIYPEFDVSTFVSDVRTAMCLAVSTLKSQHQKTEKLRVFRSSGAVCE